MRKNEQELSICGTGRIELPNPEFVVFYNGGGKKLVCEVILCRSRMMLTSEHIVKNYVLTIHFGKGLHNANIANT